MKQCKVDWMFYAKVLSAKKIRSVITRPLLRKPLKIRMSIKGCGVCIMMRRMYYGLMLEEKKHVSRFRELISQWEQKLKEFEK